MQRSKTWIVSGIFATLNSVVALSVPAQVPVAKPSPVMVTPSLPVDFPRTAAMPPQCQNVQERSERLRGEIEISLPEQARAAAERYAANPGPGVSTEKAWGDYAAGVSIAGDAQVAAWAGLKAVQIRWGGETVANAGIYLYHAAKTQDALQFLNCAYESGYRAPYLLEALAVVHQTNGNNTQARQFINQAFAAAPDDVLIETEASFINTGQPPPSRPPQRDADGLDEAIHELEQHAQRALAVIKAQTDEIEQSISDSGSRKHQQISIDYITKLVQIARDQALSARSAAPAVRQVMVNGALGTCVSAYGSITDQILSFPDSTNLNGSPLLFWADVLGLDSQSLHRELKDIEGGAEDEVAQWSMSTYHGPSLAQPAYVSYFRDKDAGEKDHGERLRACRDDPCIVRETARWCGVRKQLYQRWEIASRQRFNAAAQRFDGIATRRLIEAENEYLQLRDYAVRQLKKMRFLKRPGYDEEQVVLQGINANIKTVYDRHLNSASDAASGMVPYLRERAVWFVGERKGLDEKLANEAKELQYKCEPAIRALLDLLAQEEWQAYLDHLKDRLLWDIQPKTESEFPCEGSIGPLTIETDLNKPGEGKFDLKWKGKTFQGGGNVTVGGGGITGGGIGVGRKTTSGVSVATVSPSGPGFGQSVSYGPFQGKGKISFTSKVSPWNSQEYLGIKLKGAAGLGLSTRKGQLGMKCFPSSGSVTIYPRALYEDAVKFMSTPTTRPRPR